MKTLSPLQGPWYYAYLAPRWVLFSAPSPDQVHSIGHATFWEREVAPAVAKHYGIAGASNLKRLANIPYCFPRGRVCLRERPRLAPQYVVYFGNDWPTTLKTASAKKMILKAFNIAVAEWIFDEHETRLETDQRAFSTLAACDPYSAEAGV